MFVSEIPPGLWWWSGSVHGSPSGSGRPYRSCCGLPRLGPRASGWPLPSSRPSPAGGCWGGTTSCQRGRRGVKRVKSISCAGCKPSLWGRITHSYPSTIIRANSAASENFFRCESDSVAMPSARSLSRWVLAKTSCCFSSSSRHSFSTWRRQETFRGGLWGSYLQRGSSRLTWLWSPTCSTVWIFCRLSWLKACSSVTLPAGGWGSNTTTRL